MLQLATLPVSATAEPPQASGQSTPRNLAKLIATAAAVLVVAVVGVVVALDRLSFSVEPSSVKPML